MPVRFRLHALLEEARLSQRELAARSGVSPTIINRMANNLAEQVALKTLDSLSMTLGDALGRVVEPGELLQREIDVEPGAAEKPKRGGRT